MSDSKDLHPIALFVLSVACVFALSSAVIITIRDVAAEISKSKAEPQLYTVQTADAVYRDLTKCRNHGTWANYTTVDGKTITFNGTFTEIEQ